MLADETTGEFQQTPGLIQDPSFEAGRTGEFWKATNPDYIGGSPIFGRLANPDWPFERTGDWFLLLGVSADAIETGATQQVTVTAGDYVLRFYMLAGVGGADSTSEFWVEFGDDELVRFTAADIVDTEFVSFPYSVVEVPFTVEADGTYTLAFLQAKEAGSNINIFIDDVSLLPVADMTIADARAMGVDAEVTVQGTVTRSMGAFTYIQDETAGLTIRQPEGDFFDAVADSTIVPGTVIEVTGTLSEFANLLQINEEDLTDFSVLGTLDVPEPQLLTLDDIVTNGEDYEAELVMVMGLSTDATGDFEERTSYTVSDASATDTLRVPNADDTEVDGLPIPDRFTFTGVVGQFSFDGPNLGYQLLAIGEGDIELEVSLPIHDTGLVALEVFDNGEVGATSGAGLGFTYGAGEDADGALYEGTFLVGFSPDDVVGDAYEEPDFEWTTVSPIMPGEAPDGFDQYFTASYDDSGSSAIGVTVTQESFSNEGDAFVITSFTVDNTSGVELNDVYLGMFADWDVGDYETNVGAYDEDTRTLYVFDRSGESTNYFGVTALGNDPVSGVFYDASTGEDIAGGDTLYTSLTTIQEDATDEDDRRTVVGLGPYTIPAEGSVAARFAFVGGADEDDLLANAAAAQAAGQALFPVASEQTTQVGTYRLSAAAPNPVAHTARLGFELPTREHVTLKVYDMLGRRVATLVDEVRPEGPQTVQFDVSSLASGVYIYRLMAGSTQLSERLTVVR